MNIARGSAEKQVLLFYGHMIKRSFHTCSLWKGRKANKWSREKDKQDPLSKTFVSYCTFVLCLLVQSLRHASRPESPPCHRQEDRIAKRLQGHAERRRRMCTFLTIFSRLLFAPPSGLLQCQTPRHRRHPSSPLSTKLFRHLVCWSFKIFVARLLHCTRPHRAFSKRQEGKKTLKLLNLQILVCAVVTHSLLSVKVCLGLAIFCAF